MSALSTVVATTTSIVAVTLATLFVLYFRPTRKAAPPLVYSEGDQSTAEPGHGPIHRGGKTPALPSTSMLELLQRAVRMFPTGAFLGHRPFVNGAFGEYVWVTYEQAYERIQNFAAGLRHEKLMEPTADGHRILCIYMKNRPEWLLAQYAALYCGGFISSLYDTLGASSTQFILNQTDVQTVVCTTLEIKSVIDAKATCPSLKHIVLADVNSTDNVDVTAAKAAGLKVWTVVEVEAIGARFPTAPTYAKLTDPCFLMYTSGTTGDPKGVLLSSENIMSCTQGVIDRVGHGDVLDAMNERSVHLSYLPLAHIFEHVVITAIITFGARIGFYQGNTLKLADDLCALRPTLFPTVPRLLNKIYDKVVISAKSAGGIKPWLFNWALNTKLRNLKRGYLGHPFFDMLIFSKIQEKLGLDRCKFIAVGSAPVSPDVMNFFRIAVNFPIVEGYGQSECSGVSNVNDPRDFDSGNVGPPTASTEIKLVAVPDMGYEPTDTVHGEGPAQFAVRGRGEVCFRGPTVFSGYFKAPDKTAEAIDADGWLHSGDIGVWLVDGRLKIVDRKKNIFKLSQGEYVAPEKIENVVVVSEFVAQAFVYGDSLHAVLVAIVVPEAETVANLAMSLGITCSGVAELCQNDQVVAAVLHDIVRVCKASGLHSFEIVKAIALHPQQFTVDNDLLTPTFKLKRNEAKKAFMGTIDALYTQVGDLVGGQHVLQG
ncbi:hypothetical protein H310_11323 [Aphanomyces invadans]|uniref:AMP-dependent synthetase/ligase domain-containing protein n=1 Tax=Aphanomyces invadans TaxID=157072 RepID=A0A024TN03_9STRA|nr:hypothetical protein H310_11323 [Aphanomyces invadans]ETV94996.1 hypothetical protein H310_11323 [Aphanomyces invadans]|eukprot:XP_008876169.1 hypothetical protein H310_11323 [Aphanomyces invadans]